jgi:plastocyanin
VRAELCYESCVAPTGSFAMKPAAALLALGLIAAPAMAQSGEAQRVEVKLSSFDFDPSTIRLRAGQPVILHLVNPGKGGHNFSAPKFFAAAEVSPADRALIRKGAVEVAGHGAADVSLVPRAGHYPLKCTHTMHSMLGMSGHIEVE